MNNQRERGAEDKVSLELMGEHRGRPEGLRGKADDYRKHVGLLCDCREPARPSRGLGLQSPGIEPNKRTDR